MYPDARTHLLELHQHCPNAVIWDVSRPNRVPRPLTEIRRPAGSWDLLFSVQYPSLEDADFSGEDALHGELLKVKAELRATGDHTAPGAEEAATIHWISAEDVWLHCGSSGDIRHLCNDDYCFFLQQLQGHKHRWSLELRCPSPSSNPTSLDVGFDLSYRAAAAATWWQQLDSEAESYTAGESDEDTDDCTMKQDQLRKRTRRGSVTSATDPNKRVHHQ